MKKIATIAVKVLSVFAFGWFCTAGSASAALSVESAASSDLMTGRGYGLIQRGMFKPAVTVLKNAVQLNPNDANARRYLSYAQMQLGNCVDAQEQLKAVAKITTLTARDYYLAGSIDVRMGDNDRALKEYRSALQIEPGMPAARAGIIELFVLASDFQGATFLCNDCLAKVKNPTDYVYFRKISAYIRARQSASESSPSYAKVEVPTAVSSAVSTAITAPPAPRELIPQVIQSPLLAPPKLAPIATKAKA